MRAVGAFAALCLGVWVAIWSWARMPSPAPPLDTTEREQMMRRLRDALDGRGARAPVGFQRPFGEAMLVTLYDRGAAIVRIEAHGATLAEATFNAASALATRQSLEKLTPEVRARARLKVDLIRGRAPIFTAFAPLAALSIVPGSDGVGLYFGDREVLDTADDSMRSGVLAHYEPAPSLDFAIGVDMNAVVRQLAIASGASSSSWKATRRKLFRFRTESFIEPAHDLPALSPPQNTERQPLALFRGNAPAPEVVTEQSLIAGASAGGDYLLRHLSPDGRFDYEYDTLRDEPHSDDQSYSIPRHAGAAYYLAQLYGATHRPELLDGARRALGFLAAHQHSACIRGDRTCIGKSSDRMVELGSSAMALLAASEFERVTGDRTFQPLSRRLANFLVFMQKPNGDFCHLYEPATDQRDEKTKLLYFSGEAAFALGKLLQIDPAHADARYVGAMDRGLEYLTSTAYDYLAGQFFYGEDHWTCMAAEAGWQWLADDHRIGYSKFCDGFAAFLRRAQFTANDSIVAEQPDFLGAYSFSPFLPPHPTPVGSRSETAISIFEMDRRRGFRNEDLHQQILLGMRFLLQHQITPDSAGAYLMANPEAARGGFLMSDVKRDIRIDFIQHSCSAMLRASGIL